MKKILLPVVFAALALTGFAQKKGAVGFSFNLVDFNTPTNIKNTNFSDGVKAMQFKDLIPGFSAYWHQGITNHLDYSIRYNGAFDPKFASSFPKLKEYSNELEGAFHIRMFKDNVAVNPFLTAGAGIGNYSSSNFNAYAPLGVGIQFNLANETYFHALANYRVSFNEAKLPNNLFFSFGVSQNVFAQPEKAVKPLPVVDNTPVDTDGDGVPDAQDKCPTVAGLAKYKGCPIPDSDGDGINDEEDKCPNQKGLAKYQGCPIPDTDGDGINDEEDKCPKVKGLAKYQGCPIPDTDGDGVNDEEDKCPLVAGVKENHGCPEIKKEVIEKINKAAGNIYFATGSAKLLAKSNTHLNGVVAALKEDTSLKLNVAGHTDNTGKADKNQILSEQRAAAVKAYIVSKGIDESRIISEGFGQDKPVDTNATPAGRTKNRRVELSVKNF